MRVTPHPPHRSQACGTTALGSCLRSDAETLIRVRVQPTLASEGDTAPCGVPSTVLNYLPASLLLVPCSVRSTLLPATVCQSRSPEHGSPRPEAFSPRTPPVVGHAVGVIVHLCSFASSIICLRPTSQTRTCRALGLWPSPTGPTVDCSRSHLGSPGFRTKSLRTCSGSLTPRVRCATRVSAKYRIDFPTKSQGRQPEIGDFGAQ